MPNPITRRIIVDIDRSIMTAVVMVLALAGRADALPVTDDLVLWLDAADAGTVGDGGAKPGASITSWRDKSSRARRATGDNGPTWGAGRQNGKPVMSFDGRGQYLVLRGSGDSDPIAKLGAGEYSIWAVIRYSDSSVHDNWARRVLSNRDAGNTGGFSASIAADRFGFQTACQGSFAGTRPTKPNTWYIVNVYRAGLLLTQTINGQHDGLDVSIATAQAAPNALHVGAVFAGTGCFAGDVAEILIYNRGLDDKQRGQVGRYLSDKWGIAMRSTPQPTPQVQAGPLKLLDVREIYGDGTHNGWPDICRWRGKYYVAFNGGGKGHNTGHGIRVIASSDGKKWETMTDVLRFKGKFPNWWQPKFIPTDDRLYMMFYTEVPVDGKISDPKKAELKKKWLELGGVESSFNRWVSHHGNSFRTGVTWSKDGKTWSPPEPLLEQGWRMHTATRFGGKWYMVPMWCHGQRWSITPQLARMIPRAHKPAAILPDETSEKLKDHVIRNDGKAFPLGPRRGKTIEMFESAHLMVSQDGRHWSKLSDIAADDNDESHLDFAPDGRCLVVSRHGASAKQDLAYVADPPYTNWRPLRLNRVIQQPAVKRVGKHWVVGGRGMVETTMVPARFAPNTAFDVYCPVRLWVLDDQTGKLTGGLILPSWGDAGHPGMVLNDAGELLVVYYTCTVRSPGTKLMGPGPLPGKFTTCSIYMARVGIQ